MVDEEVASERRGAHGDDADGSLQLDPERVPGLVLRSVYLGGYAADEADGDHEEAQAEDEGDAELLAGFERGFAEDDGGDGDYWYGSAGVRGFGLWQDLTHGVRHYVRYDAVVEKCMLSLHKVRPGDAVRYP